MGYGFDICKNDHAEIVYKDEFKCPICVLIEDLKSESQGFECEVERLTFENENLTKSISELKKDLEDLKKKLKEQ